MTLNKAFFNQAEMNHGSNHAIMDDEKRPFIGRTA